MNNVEENGSSELETAVLGAGCFWCTEAVYQRISGVIKVVPGFSGGHVENPTTMQVYRGDTGHIEVAKIDFDPKMISYPQLLEYFWKMHDPTSRDRQGADVGEQYRSVIFYLDEKQKEQAEKSKKKLETKGVYDNKIVTDILPLKEFYEAEDYHKNYYENNKNRAYCRLVIDPKLKKLSLDD